MSQRFMFYASIVLAALLMVPVHPALAATNDSAIKTDWSYKGSKGPEFWGRLNPEFMICGRGKEQSPINITKNDVQAANTLYFHYTTSPLYIMENGNTVLTIGKTNTIVNDGHTVQVNFHPEAASEYVMYENKKYQLVQLHFHSPSENQINGVSTPLEVHFVHQGSGGDVLVIAALIKGGEANSTLQTIIDHLPAADGKEYAIKDETILPQELLPLDNDYYSYMGSLTTPPCTQGLKWVVMAATVTASPAQIVSLRQAIGGSNARAVQPLNGRMIRYAISRA